jgi:hypothetical protein
LEVENGVGGRAGAPEAEAFLPPAQEEIEPLPVLREGDLHLDLLARSDAALERVRAFEDAADQSLVVGAQGIAELAIDEIVREIGAEPHLRHGLHQQQREIEVVGNAVAVGFEEDGHADLVGHRHPGADRWRRLLDPQRHDQADDIHELRVELARGNQHRAQVLDRFRE